MSWGSFRRACVRAGYARAGPANLAMSRLGLAGASFDRSGDLVQAAVRDVEHEPVNGHAPEERMLAQDRDLGAHVLLQVAEAAERDRHLVGGQPTVRRNGSTQRGLVDTVQAATGVLDDDDLVGPEQ